MEAVGNEHVAATSQHAQAGFAIQHELRSLIGQLNIFERISRCPIVAVAGSLNAGKSSLLATFLSTDNRHRVLRGLGNQAGTHRFVFWLPEIWGNDPDLLHTLVHFFSELFGHPPEHLSQDAQQAALQYNGHVDRSALLKPSNASDPLPEVDPLSIPLIAYDAALDDLQVGLVDSPDIQTGFFSAASGAITGGALAAARQQQLARMGRLCSAFIVVSKMNNLHDQGLFQILATLRDSMPGVPRLLAVNKIKARYAPEVVYEQARGLVERFGLQAVFAAYDFRSTLAHTRIPSPPASMNSAGEDLPIFFELSPQASPAALPAANPPPRYLLDLGDRLDVGALSLASSRSLILQLKAKTSEAVEWLEINQELQQQQIHDGWQSIAAAAYEFMAERDAGGRTTGLRLQASPAIVAQMADSLQRTAPAWMRISLSIDRTARQFQQAVSNSASRFKILQSASASVTQFARKFRRGEGAQVVTPQRLADQIRGYDVHDALQAVPPQRLVDGCELAMKRFAAEDKTLLDQPQLDEWSRQIWAGMSWKDKLWKGTQPLAVLMAPLLAAVLVPIDGGGTAVLVFASAKELLAAAGIAAVMAPMATGGEALRIVRSETPWRQLSDLFAIICDCLGLPRPLASELPSAKCEGGSRRLLPSNLDVKLNARASAVKRWQLPRESLSELRVLTQEPT